MRLIDQLRPCLPRCHVCRVAAVSRRLLTPQASPHHRDIVEESEVDLSYSDKKLRCDWTGVVAT